MKKAICLAVAAVMMMTLAGVASAENKIGVGYYFRENKSVLSLAGELSLTGKMAFGFDYVGIKDASVTELFGKLALRDLGGANVGVFGGVKLIQGVTSNIFKVGLYCQQAVSPEIAAYGKAGLAFQSGSSKSWVEALGGLKAKVMAPFWLSGEAIYSGGEVPDKGTGFRVLVGMNF